MSFGFVDIPASPYMTIGELKQICRVQFQVGDEVMICLQHDGHYMDNDEETIGDYGLEQGDTIYFTHQVYNSRIVV